MLNYSSIDAIARDIQLQYQAEARNAALIAQLPRPASNGPRHATALALRAIARRLDPALDSTPRLAVARSR